MNTWLHLYSINSGYWTVLVISWFYFYLTTKRKCASCLKCKWGILHTNALAVWLTHVYIKLHLLKLELRCLLCKKLPIILFFSFGKRRLFGFQLFRSVTDNNIDNAFKHSFKSDILILPFCDFGLSHLLDNFIVQLTSFYFFGDFGSAKRTFLID
jgi:hypothetical protein